jgi:tetratricopeptide (TPR) repeat protein
VNRALYAAGWGYVALCGWVLLTRSGPRTIPSGGEPSAPQPAFRGAAGEWFAQVKPFCNAVEVEVRQQQLPAPQTVEGAGYSAACYALAGKIDRAREVIERLDGNDRSAAAGIVFTIGHPVADAGDDQSAGPIMRLVVTYQPQNYMALYHAGMSEYILGQKDLAKTHLTQFLDLYHDADGWRSNALTVLNRIDRGQ